MPLIVKLLLERRGLEIDLLNLATGIPMGFKIIDEQWTPANAGFDIFTPDQRVQETLPLTCDNASFNVSHDYMQHIIRAARQYGMNIMWTDYAWLYYTTALENPKRTLLTNAYLQPIQLPGKSPLHRDKHVQANLIAERMPWWETETYRTPSWDGLSIPNDVPQRNIPGRGTIPSRIARLIITAPDGQTDALNHFWIGIKPRDEEDAEGGPGQPSEFISSWNVRDGNHAVIGVTAYPTDPIGAGDISITWRVTHNSGQFGNLIYFVLNEIYVGTRAHHFIGRYLVLGLIGMNDFSKTFVARLSYGATFDRENEHIYTQPVEVQPSNVLAHYYELGYIEIPTYSMKERNTNDIEFYLFVDGYILEDGPPAFTRVNIRHVVLMPANHISIRNGKVHAPIATVPPTPASSMTIRRTADDKVVREGAVDIHYANNFHVTPAGGEIVFAFQREAGLDNDDTIEVEMHIHDRFDTWRNDPTVPEP